MLTYNQDPLGKLVQIVENLVLEINWIIIREVGWLRITEGCDKDNIFVLHNHKTEIDLGV